MTSEEWAERLRPWLRAEHAPAFAAALGWLWPRCRSEEERCLTPALLLLLSPLNALVAPCRPAAGSCVNFQVTLSRPGDSGPERVRLTVRAGSGVQAFECSGVQGSKATEHRTVWLDAAAVLADPLGGAARVLEALLEWRQESPMMERRLGKSQPGR